MANTNRLKVLLEILESAPDDPLNWYLLATEYRETDPIKALDYYKHLLNQFPEYAPTYYHAAKIYEELENFSAAEEVFRKGVEILTQQKEHKLLKELQAAYQNFLLENG